MKAVLLDLDGTLLPVDSELMLEKYLKLLAKKVASFIEPEEFLSQLLTATATAIADEDPAKTIKEVFLADFFARVAVPPEVLLPVFDEFYRREYRELKAYIQITAYGREIVEILGDKGYRLVLATNPLFPQIAISERLNWLGIKAEQFELITAYENMHFCKPNPKYYEEILALLNLPGHECLMAGNHMQEDMVAASLGLKTFLVTDYLIDLGSRQYPVDHRGSLQELRQFVEEKL